MKPKISIVVPIYKVQEKYLRQCIESCINQTFNEIEIILVDDGSPDDCGMICDEYANRDERIKVIHKKNGGLVSARNAGLEAVSGIWHMYLDGDDWMDLGTCEKLLSYIPETNVIDIVFWNHILELEDRSIKGKLEWNCKDQIHFYSTEECKDLARNTLIYKSGIATAYCKLVRTSFALNCSVRHDERLRQGLEGVEYSLRAFYYARSVMYVKDYFNHYRYNPNSISKRVDERNTAFVIDCLRVMEEDISLFQEQITFKKALYQRTVYALIAISMNTYFHPTNPNSILSAYRKFSHVINDNKLCKIAIRETALKDIDKQRRIALLLMKMRLYFLLKPIAMLKYRLLKKGYYNY